MLVLRIAVVVAGVFMLMLFALVTGLVVDPLIESAQSSEAVQDLGIDESLDTLALIGLSFVLPLLGLAVLIWFHTAELQQDIGHRRY